MFILGVIKKLTKIDKIPDIPKIPTLSPKRLIGNEENIKYDPCAVYNLCLNGGTCLSRGNK